MDIRAARNTRLLISMVTRFFKKLSLDIADVPAA